MEKQVTGEDSGKKLHWYALTFMRYENGVPVHDEYHLGRTYQVLTSRFISDVRPEGSILIGSCYLGYATKEDMENGE